jgi:hypothetical protein
MVPLAVPARSLGWGSTRDTLYLKSLEFPCDASSCDDTRVPVFMREDRNQTLQTFTRGRYTASRASTAEGFL